MRNGVEVEEDDFADEGTVGSMTTKTYKTDGKKQGQTYKEGSSAQYSYDVTGGADTQHADGSGSYSYEIGGSRSKKTDATLQGGAQVSGKMREGATVITETVTDQFNEGSAQIGKSGKYRVQGEGSDRQGDADYELSATGASKASKTTNQKDGSTVQEQTSGDKKGKDGKDGKDSKSGSGWGFGFGFGSSSKDSKDKTTVSGTTGTQNQ
jgi:hypothetical protein